MDDNTWVALVVIFLVLMGVIWAWGFTTGENSVREVAVKEGAAYWGSDENGEAKIVWSKEYLGKDKAE
jgi:hypothetical protein